MHDSYGMPKQSAGANHSSKDLKGRSNPNESYKFKTEKPSMRKRNKAAVIGKATRGGGKALVG